MAFAKVSDRNPDMPHAALAWQGAARPVDQLASGLERCAQLNDG